MDAMNTPVWRLSPDVQQPLGPYSTAQVQTMFSNGQLSETVGVWREGMAEWTPVQQLFSQVWWYASPDQQQRWGPFSIAQTQAMLADNQISTSYYAWMEGMPQWKQLEQVFSQGSQGMDTVDAPVWWITIDGQQTWGPYSAAQLNTMLTNNQTSPSVYVRRDSDSEWTPLQNIFPQGHQSAPVPNPPAVSGPAPQRSEWTCSLCGGAGWSPCGLCNGTGTKNISGSVPRNVYGNTGEVPQYIEIEPRYCIKCNGKGTITCRQCNGTGRI